MPVALPPAEAFRLFTASGERCWAHGWEPVFPAPVDDETQPGTVFTTAHGEDVTTWVVTAAEPGRSISYARCTPGERAGTVTVCCREAADGSTEAEVSYDLTALSPAAEDELRHFADGFEAFLEDWRTAIAASLGR